MTSVRKSLLSIWRKRKRGFSWNKNPPRNGCSEETVWKQKEDLEEGEEEEVVREKKPRGLLTGDATISTTGARLDSWRVNTKSGGSNPTDGSDRIQSLTRQHESVSGIISHSSIDTELFISVKARFFSKVELSSAILTTFEFSRQKLNT